MSVNNNIITEQKIFKICQNIIGNHTNGEIYITQPYKIILDLEHYPQRLAQLINILNKKFNINLTHFISPEKTPAATIMYLDKFIKPSNN